MFSTNEGAIALSVLRSLIEELEQRDPGFTIALESRLASAALGDVVDNADLFVRQSAHAFVAALTPDQPAQR